MKNLAGQPWISEFSVQMIVKRNAGHRSLQEPVQNHLDDLWGKLVQRNELVLQRAAPGKLEWILFSDERLFTVDKSRAIKMNDFSSPAFSASHNTSVLWIDCTTVSILWWPEQESVLNQDWTAIMNWTACEEFRYTAIEKWRLDVPTVFCFCTWCKSYTELVLGLENWLHPQGRMTPLKPRLELHGLYCMPISGEECMC